MGGRLAVALPEPINPKRRSEAIPRTITPEHRKAMQQGRAKSASRARRAAVKRVLAFRAWMEKDVEYYRQLRQWTEYGMPMTMKGKPQPPATGVPSDNDYKIAREEGAIQ